MDSHQLQTFAAAAELQSFTRAALTLGVSQPAVSHQVASLEKELKVSLFKRAGRTITLTTAGRHLYDYARKILDLLNEARQEVGHSSTTVRGALQIATCTIPPESFLPDVVARFCQLYPEVFIFMNVSDSAQATRAVETGVADVGIVAQPEGRRLQARAINRHEHELVLAVSPDHPLAEPKTPRHPNFEMRLSCSVNQDRGVGTSSSRPCKKPESLHVK